MAKTKKTPNDLEQELNDVAEVTEQSEEITTEPTAPVNPTLARGAEAMATLPEKWMPIFNTARVGQSLFYAKDTGGAEVLIVQNELSGSYKAGGYYAFPGRMDSVTKQSLHFTLLKKNKKQ